VTLGSPRRGAGSNCKLQYINTISKGLHNTIVITYNVLLAYSSTSIIAA
jgi:hypothetical protein